jgi:hypothetical protein
VSIGEKYPERKGLVPGHGCGKDIQKVGEFIEQGSGKQK